MFNKGDHVQLDGDDQVYIIVTVYDGPPATYDLALLSAPNDVVVHHHPAGGMKIATG
jgi:hypothetical protein